MVRNYKRKITDREGKLKLAAVAKEKNKWSIRETAKKMKDLQMPKFVKVLKEVTNDNRYASGTIAKIGWKMPEEDKVAIRTAAQQ